MRAEDRTKTEPKYSQVDMDHELDRIAYWKELAEERERTIDAIRKGLRN